MVVGGDLSKEGRRVKCNQQPTNMNPSGPAAAKASFIARFARTQVAVLSSTSK
jgi:hypothetical protein